MALSSILIAGDSHVLALGVPPVSKDGGFHLRPLAHPSGQIFGLVGGGLPRKSDYWDALRERARGCVVAIIWRGNQHLAGYLIARPRRFDLVISDQPDLPVDETAELLPEAAFCALFSAEFNRLENEIEALKAAGAFPALVGTPPPKGDDEFIREVFAKEGIFAALAKDLGQDLATVPLSPPLLRYKLWAILQKALRDAAAARGIPFVAVSREAQTDEGFLRPEYYWSDVTHANRAYGDLMLETLWRHFAADQASVPAP